MNTQIALTMPQKAEGRLEPKGQITIETYVTLNWNEFCDFRDMLETLANMTKEGYKYLTITEGGNE